MSPALTAAGAGVDGGGGGGGELVPALGQLRLVAPPQPGTDSQWPSMLSHVKKAHGPQLEEGGVCVCEGGARVVFRLRGRVASPVSLRGRVAFPPPCRLPARSSSQNKALTPRFPPCLRRRCSRGPTRTLFRSNSWGMRVGSSVTFWLGLFRPSSRLVPPLPLTCHVTQYSALTPRAAGEGGGGGKAGAAVSVGGAFFTRNGGEAAPPPPAPPPTPRATQLPHSMHDARTHQALRARERGWEPCL